jgi:hypothetical protein
MDEPLMREPLLGRVLGAVVVLASACWLCVYPVLFVLSGLAVLLATSQGHELLESTSSAMFHAAVAAWALAAWYCSRVLLKRRFTGRFASRVLDSDAGFAGLVRAWLPRVLGAAIYVSLAAWFLLAARQTVQALIVAGCGAAYWLLVVYRRTVLARAEPAALRRERLDRATRIALALALAGSFALLVAFLVSPVALPRRFGAVPIILLAFTSWILFGSIALVLLPKIGRLPSLALLPLVLALAGPGTDNHEPRQALPDGLPPRAASLEAAALEWLQAHATEFREARARGDEAFPVYIATAEGGGLRAAYWTGNVLGELELATGGRFSRRLFAVSSVSGGSLGAAAWLAELDAPCNGSRASGRDCVRRFLKGDFLAPVAAYLLFPDMLQRFLPFAAVRSFDRARALELSWERSWADTHAGAANAFAQPYERLGGSRAPRPKLFLNATRVETGKRVLVSPARFDEDEMPEADDLLALGARRWTLPLSSAVHLSARFAYVSPPAKICEGGVPECHPEDAWGRLVDGGYHENSGAQSAADLLRALRRAARRFEAAQPAGPTRVQARVVMITNDVGSTRLCDEAPPAEPARWYAELASPMRAIWNARIARGAEARRALADAAAGLRRDPLDKDCAGDGTRSNTLEFSLAAAHRPARTPALGWFLAAGSTRLMDEALCRVEHLRALESVRRELGAAAPYACGAQL